ncbi:unnamed protein product [Pipistrellus nathusii]|uniref:Uncharacterized protein n=1 Tax=Pipistrellus nathusii TaxID=59473 RepID=A0ABN9Z5J3_PIPNA
MKQIPSSLSALAWSFGDMAQQPGGLGKAEIGAVGSRGAVGPSGCRKQPEPYSWLQRCWCQGCPEPRTWGCGSTGGSPACNCRWPPGPPIQATRPRSLPLVCSDCCLRAGKLSSPAPCSKGETRPERLREGTGPPRGQDPADVLTVLA